MARKNVNGPFLFFSASDISTDQTSTYSSVEYLDNCGIIVNWSGTTPIGTLFVDVSNDPPTGSSLFAPTNWTNLNFGSAITVSGNTGTADINMNQLPYMWLRMRYVRTSGTGTLTASLLAKMV